VVTVITVVALAGVVALVAVAITVGILDNAQRAAWRRVAAERRQRWEARQLSGGGGAPPAWEPSRDDD
jgi:hypothetical protein